MEDPDKTLKDLLETNWSLTGDLAKDKMGFSLVGWRTDKGLYNTPNVNVQRVRLARVGGSGTRENFFEYVANVNVVYWPTSKTAKGMELAKTVIWQMIEEVKKILVKDNLPAEWNWVQVNTTIKEDITEVIPPVLEEKILAAIRLFWEVS